MFTHIDLFSGIGGFRLAVEYNKGCCIGYSEIDQNAIKTYTLNFTKSEPKAHGLKTVGKASNKTSY